MTREIWQQIARRLSTWLHHKYLFIFWYL